LIDNQRDLSHYVISPLRTFVRLRILLLDWKKNIEKYTNEKLVTFYISLFSITESVVNPVPVEVILIPSVIKFRKKFIKFALIASIMSTIGALIGYLLGFYLEEYMIRNFIDLSDFGELYGSYGPLIILIGAVTPFPFKLVTIASGIFKINVFYLIIYSFIGRYFRYQIVTAMTYIIGPKMIDIYDKIDKSKKVMIRSLIILTLIAILTMLYIYDRF
jgi:membrane protein YqaA with SNARE-associated domain